MTFPGAEIPLSLPKRNPILTNSTNPETQVIDQSLPRWAAITGITLLLAGCESWGGKVEEIPRAAPEKSGTFNDASLLGGDGLSLKKLIGPGEAASNTLPVNKYLWRASLDTLSFLPLSSTDPFSGVIATEWGASPDSPNERVRVTAYVEGKELTARALDVSVFRETLSASGAWVAASVNPATAEQVKDKILLRARELRQQDVDGPKV